MTLPSDIPEDVKRAAIDLADTIILTREADGQSASYAAWLRSSIARAIMAERDRSAAVGYRVCAQSHHVTLGERVAAAIRNGDAS